MKICTVGKVENGEVVEIVDVGFVDDDHQFGLTDDGNLLHIEGRDFVAESLHPVTGLIDDIGNRYGTTGRTSNYDDIYNLLSDLLVELCSSDSLMVKKFPVLLAKENELVGVYLKVGTAPMINPAPSSLTESHQQ